MDTASSFTHDGDRGGSEHFRTVSTKSIWEFWVGTIKQLKTLAKDKEIKQKR